MKKTITVDIKKCLACKSCEIACALVHSKSKVLEEAVTESPAPQRRVVVEGAGEFGVPMQCRHCEQAPCITVCPTAAIHRHEVNSPVLIDRENCIGCGYCLIVCPFGVIDITRDGRAVAKCDLCIERTKVGQAPACVESCPTGALEFCELTEGLIERRRAEAAQAMVALNRPKREVEDFEDEPEKG
ncbi:MAG: 4Fe-4S dicluster domain-containing protein [Planctomycetota bacterium]